MNNGTKIFLWDWPIRVFHWLFAMTILLALGIALFGEHSSIFQWHMLFGLSAGFLLVLRMVMGFIRSKPYSYGDQYTSLKKIPTYVKGILRQDASDVLGHNPLAWVVYSLMFFCLAMTVLTGANMHSEWAEEIHSVFAWTLLATIVLHLIGMGIHTYRFRENVALSMLHGKKMSSEDEGHRSSHPIVGAILLVLTVLFMGQLFSNYQSGSESVRLPWIGKEIILGEGDHEHGDGGDDSHYKEHDDHEHRERDDHHGHDDDD